MYRVIIQHRARKQIARLPADVGRHILAAITALGTNPRPPGCRKLTDKEQWRIKVQQDYRVIYTISDTDVLVTIVWAGNRKDAY